MNFYWLIKFQAFKSLVFVVNLDQNKRDALSFHTLKKWLSDKLNIGKLMITKWQVDKLDKFWKIYILWCNYLRHEFEKLFS